MNNDEQINETHPLLYRGLKNNVIILEAVSQRPKIANAQYSAYKLLENLTCSGNFKKIENIVIIKNCF